MTSEELFDAVNGLWEVHDDPEADLSPVESPPPPAVDPVAALARFLGETFAADPTAPSVVIGWLAAVNQFYVSVRRYGRKHAQDPRVVCAATGNSLLAAVDGLTDQVEKLVPPKVGDTVFTVRPAGDRGRNVVEWLVTGVGDGLVVAFPAAGGRAARLSTAVLFRTRERAARRFADRDPDVDDRPGVEWLSR